MSTNLDLTYDNTLQNNLDQCANVCRVLCVIYIGAVIVNLKQLRLRDELLMNVVIVFQ